MYIGFVEVMFLIGLCLFLVNNLFYARIERKLWENDHLIAQEVRPRLYGISYYAGVAAVNGGVAIVAFATNNSVAALGLLGGCALFGFFLLKLLGTSISYDEEMLIVSERKSICEIPTANIQHMRWERAHSTIGPSLVIYLWGGSKIVLHHMDYVGLRKMANFFYLKFYDDSEAAGESG